MRGRGIAALALVPILGCGSLAIQEDASARIEAALAAYAVSIRSMDADRIAANFAPGGELQNPGQEPIQGPDAIRARLKSFGGVTVLEHEMKGNSLQIVGPGALQAGTFRQKVRLADGKVVETKGTFEAEWDRMVDGSWKLSRMATNPPPFEPVKEGETP